MTDRYVQQYLAEMKALQEEMTEMQGRMTQTERNEWARILEDHEFFDGEVEIQHGHMVAFMERNYVNRGVA